ncbi:MAG: hypothetical protein JRJ27_18740, partial [Deltaproteobacteria bacterium]|nr:hypothetical protein [Deltaproteobacteria bacterium]
VFETDEFSKRFKKLSSRDVSFLRKKLDSFVYPQIKKEPFWGNNIKKFQGYSPDTWRYRIGKFRLFYIVDQDEKIIYMLIFYIVDQDEKIIYMLTVDDRKDAYR